MKSSKSLPNRKFGGKVYFPIYISRTEEDAKAHVKEIRAAGMNARIVPFPKNVSTEFYGKGPGMSPPKYVVYWRR